MEGSADSSRSRSIWPSPSEALTFAQLLIEVDDVKAFVERAAAKCAWVLSPPQALADGDVMAVMLDPQGMSFGLMQGSGH
jgi:predicted enzyme related to lactoylglutathione lyase